MRGDALSLRQVTVLTVTALLAPAVDVLPGAVSWAGGTAGWLAPLVSLPLLLLWVWMLGDLLRGEGKDLAGVARQGLGPFLGRISTLLYIMWGAALLAAQLGRSARRMGAVYGPAAGRTMATLALVLALWMVWRKVSALCRAGELFWLAMGVVALGVVAMAVPQVEPVRLLPQGRDWWGGLTAVPVCLLTFAPAVLATALVGHAPRTATAKRMLPGWTVALCLLSALLAGAVVGQMGPGLAQRLEQPFFVMVQGLSLQGALARLEGLTAALWLLADFAYAGLMLAALRVLGGERWGRWVALGAAALAAVSSNWAGWGQWGSLGGLFLGVLLPAVIWVLCKTARRDK